MTALTCAIRLAWILDFLALLALAGTGEVNLGSFAAVSVVFILSQLLSLQSVSQGWPYGLISRARLGLPLLLVLVVTGAVWAWLGLHWHPILAAAFAAPLIHSISWLAQDSGRNRGWRMGLGFVELVLASALTTEAYLFLTIFIFIILGAIAASCNFLDLELKQRAPELTQEALPRGFLWRSFGLASLIFLSSLIIFPILPRMAGERSGGEASVRVGYTESVSLVEGLKLNGNEGTGQTVLWFYPRGGEDLTKLIFLGLIRGRSLDVFDGNHWSASPVRSRIDEKRISKSTELENTIQVDAIRGAMPTAALPVPYGTLQTFTSGSDSQTSYPRTRGGEWVDYQTQTERARYSFAFVPYLRSFPDDRRKFDPPMATDLYIPEVIKTERMQRLVHGIFAGPQKDREKGQQKASERGDERDKVSRLANFFLHERFSASLDDGIVSQEGQGRLSARWHPLEKFLLITKKGHCEWFASASAVLLRMAGVPTRLVAGFRMSKGPLGGVQGLTTNDAHAWVEYWEPARGWVALDPTPRLLRPSSMTNFLRDGYEWISAYWYRYVLSYRSGNQGADTISSPAGLTSGLGKWQQRFRQTFNDHWKAMLVASLLLFGLSLSFYFFLRLRYPWIFSIRYRVREGALPLRHERVQMERLLAVQLRKMRFKGAVEDALPLLKDSPLIYASLEQWQNLYLQLRFGRVESTQAQALLALQACSQSVKQMLHCDDFN